MRHCGAFVKNSALRANYQSTTHQLLTHYSFTGTFFSRKELLIPDQRHPSSVFVCYLDTFSSAARLTAEQVAWVLNCQTHDVPVLVAARLLRPPGNPQKNGIKFFTTADLLELVKDKAWLLVPLGRGQASLSKLLQK